MSIRENPNEMQNSNLEQTSNLENEKQQTESSLNEEKPLPEQKTQFFQISNDNPTEFFSKSFKAIIEKPIDCDDSEQITIKSSTRLRRTTSKFGISECFSKVRPKISRKTENVNIFAFSLGKIKYR